MSEIEPDDGGRGGVDESTDSIELTETDVEPEGLSDDVTDFQHYELAEPTDISLGESLGVEAVGHGVEHLVALTIESEPSPLLQQMGGDDDDGETETITEGRMFISNEDGDVGLAVSVVEDDDTEEAVTIDDVEERFHADDLRFHE